VSSIGGNTRGRRTGKYFNTTHPPEGLGGDLAVIRNIIRDDTEAVDLFDKAVKNPNALHSVQGKKAPTGNSTDAGLRRLRKNRPELHKRVLCGALTVHGAMKVAGFRKVPSAIEVAQKAYRKLGPRERAAFLAWVKRQ
jgi:hypothetical protein